MAARGRRRSGERGGPVTLFLLIVVPLSLIFMPTALVIGAGLIPTAVAFLIDRDPDKTAPMTVGAVNFVGAMAFVIQLWQREHSLAAALAILSNPFAWAGMYGAAALGWGIYYAVPPMVAGFSAMRAQARIDKLREQQAALVAEWGPEVKGETPLQPQPAAEG
ncbi:hypothetical protein [Arenibaculum pallidiluteum]|uniref:hypothetical protein n=1 Tax=Arenibaculum pallidiluteum TaxID=2812559 RepID=UPI001A967B33|nr:hypothetical protein [Arenibaculum pallidiluteum]